MRISDRYIGRQVLLGTLSAIAVLSILLVLGNLFREMRPLLVEQRAPVTLLIHFALNVLPFSLMYTIPWGFLSATLLVMGRLSSDREITGFRIAGFSLVRLSVPIFVISLFCSALCYWLNVDMAPKAKAAVSNLLYEQVKRDPRSLLDPGVVQARFGNQKAFVERKSGDELIGFNLYRIPQADAPNNPLKPGDQDAPPAAYLHAGKVSLVVDKEKQLLRLTLDDAFLETRKPDGSVEPAFSRQAEPWIFDYSMTNSPKQSPGLMTNPQIWEFLRSEKNLTEKQRSRFHTELTQRVSFSFACIAFAFIAVPLGINTRRKETTSSNFGLSLLIGAAYFLFSMFSRQFNSDAVTTAVLWAPNIACILLGIILFRRARFK
jgi:lipopolysaccharide export LptBFGC system permease protein LptF